MASLRHRVRTLALQALFELDATDHAPDEVVGRWIEDELLPPEGERFLRQLIFGVWEHYSYLDRIIEGAAPSWPVNQMPGVDKAILRIALYEILIDEIRSAGLYDAISQAFAVLLPVKTVGVMGDERTYENVLAIRCVQTSDFMTADWFRLPHDVLDSIASRIVGSVRGINRVVYDVTSKPPGTIEWE